MEPTSSRQPGQRWWGAILVLAACSEACNGAFGVRETQLVDGAPPDAMARCPAIGETPSYSGALSQVLAQPCTNYTLSITAGLAIALCPEGVSLGPIGEPMQVAPGFPAPTANE